MFLSNWTMGMCSEKAPLGDQNPISSLFPNYQLHLKNRINSSSTDRMEINIDSEVLISIHEAITNYKRKQEGEATFHCSFYICL